MSADRSVIAAWGTVPPQNRPRDEWAVTAVAAVLVADIGPDGVGPDPVGRVDLSVSPSQVTADGLARFDTTTARAVARLLLEAADRADAAAAGTGPSADGEPDVTRPGSVQGTDPRHACPECGGHRLVGDPTGLRVDHAVRCSIRSAEDSRKVADLDAVGGPRRQRGHADPVRRPPTAAERTLLAAFGLPADEIAEVVVTRETPLGGLVRRDFRLDDGTVLDLDAPTPEPEPTTTEPSTKEST